MNLKQFAVAILLASIPTAASYAAPTSKDSASLQITSDLKIPGANLSSGTYTVSVEDRLIDRAIVRIESSSNNSHFLLVAVPSKQSPDLAGAFSYFTADNNGKALRSWKCQTCASPLEFVYPKSEAVALTASSGKPVLAMDPSYDKLPGNLSPDDMKVVTLWLAKPKTVTADNKGQGVTATKLADIRGGGHPETASKSTPVNPKQEVADAGTTAHRLPHTASNTFVYLTAGLAALAGALLLRLRGAYQS